MGLKGRGFQPGKEYHMSDTIAVKENMASSPSSWLLKYFEVRHQPSIVISASQLPSPPKYAMNFTRAAITLEEHHAIKVATYIIFQ
jgi:hypothetical protein